MTQELVQVTIRRFIHLESEIMVRVLAPHAGSGGFYTAQVTSEDSTFRAGLAFGEGTTHADLFGEFPEFYSRDPFLAEAYALEHLAQVLRTMKR